jgi:hypothetical protein
MSQTEENSNSIPGIQTLCHRLLSCSSSPELPYAIYRSSPRIPLDCDRIATPTVNDFETIQLAVERFSPSRQEAMECSRQDR